MPTPPKPVIVLENEKRSHRTKAELASRRESEQSLESGAALKEWRSVKQNPVAHKEFTRLNKLLKNIQKNDALYQGVINRYCLLMAECDDLENKREEFFGNVQELKEATPPEERSVEFYNTLSRLQQTVIACDKQVQAKRKMMLDIEKENIMTIASALRSIPKKPTETEDEDDMREFLRCGRA